MKLIFFPLIIVLFLTGCAAVGPTRLGIPQADWEQYSPAKKAQLLASYEDTQHRKKAMPIQSGNGVLTVNIAGGKALLPPYTHLITYEPVDFTVKQGDCHKKISITTTDANSQKGKLEVCYTNNTLYLDPSPYDPALSLGSLQFPYMPVWKRGFTYPHVSSTGLLKLNNVAISLKQVVAADE
jgi:hypothetical protein